MQSSQCLLKDLATCVQEPRPLAIAIGALKKPTRSAWLVNLLSREDASAVAELSNVAGRVTAAHQAADLTALRAVGGERQRLVDALIRRAVVLAGERGQVVTEAVRLEVHGTLAAAGAILSRQGEAMLMTRPRDNTAPKLTPLPSTETGDATGIAGRYTSAELEADLVIEARDGAAFARFRLCRPEQPGHD